MSRLLPSKACLEPWQTTNYGAFLWKKVNGFGFIFYFKSNAHLKIRYEPIDRKMFETLT